MVFEKVLGHLLKSVKRENTFWQNSKTCIGIFTDSYFIFMRFY